MSNPSIVGFSGNCSRPSKTRAFVDLIVQNIASRHRLSHQTYDVEDVGPSLGAARWHRDLDAQAQTVVAHVVAADVLVVGSPTYKGSYTGLFKHFFDLLDPRALRGKPVLLTATGGGERHALVVEHQLRPLFGFFEAFALPTAVYATDKDFTDGVLRSELILKRAAQAVDETAVLLATKSGLRIDHLVVGDDQGLRAH
ncbi:MULTISPECIES: FMN reductase [unclassified Mesorhizobium]|uniref:FMN reductase n=1 Tax=unclassified Mesorhizobium TaxID=325217 RepID=UPI0007FD3A14|nr:MULTISPECIES: FMN reductase [unclassified Mesorhizobium]OBQ81569.1 FMN reductase [Mesorhizobium sp. WSM3873]PBB77585.1 FMN reductase [Mesorhizobium sp. WSM3879]